MSASEQAEQHREKNRNREQTKKKKKRRKHKRPAYREASLNRQPGDPNTRESFCRKYAISEGAFFKMKREGKGPREIEIIGRRFIITPEAEREWLAEREAETEAKREAAEQATAA